MKNIVAFAFLFSSSLFFDCSQKEGNREATSSDSLSVNDTSKAKALHPRYVRKNANSESAKKDLEALERAFTIMRGKDCSDPTSWYYQAAIHWVPPFISNNKLCSSYTRQSTDAKPGWFNCTHKGEGEQIHFLVWHRLYIHHLEKIVRKLSGYAEFALPYWDYTDTVNMDKNLVMPAIFQQSGSSLFENCRRATLNRGQAIDETEFLNIAALMENYTTYRTFNENIDGAPHGFMHGYIGRIMPDQRPTPNPITQVANTGRGLMGTPITAAFDPIFWLHHANIDRVWQKWTNSVKGQDASAEELAAVYWPYIFFDENGDSVRYKAEEMLDYLYTMDYDYDDTNLGHAPGGVVKSNFIPEDGDTLVKRKLNISIKKKETSFTVQTAGVQKNNFLKSDSSQTRGPILLTITVSFTTVPEGNYEVYINSKGKTKHPRNRNFSGFMTFFGADHHMEMHKHHKGAQTKTFNFELAEELRSKVINANSFDISIIRTGALETEQIKVESVTVSSL